ncbi:hypothetical protein KI387_033137, partial [Taxus chinensis]
MATGNEITNAFEGIGSPSVFASASSSKRTTQAPYDVFINHRGTDVKHTLASAIYRTLHPLGLRVFLDVEVLELGDVIPVHIQDAMRTSFLHIAIFSSNYAQSPWCLAELSFILRTGSRVIPVFYDVEPADLRWACQGKGIYATAFSLHQANDRYTSEKLEEWKMALHRVSFHSGYILKNNDDEGNLLKSIVNCVLNELKKVPLEVAKHPVGLDEAVQDFERMAFESSKNVQIIGIVGMGGSGKTTLAKMLYNKKSFSMARCSFLFDVRDTAYTKNLQNKQKKLLQDLGFKDLLFDDVEEGKQILASCFRSLCLFIILDDVDHQDQLDALLPGIDSLGWGSLIIVTSRELGVLTSWGVSSIYKMKGLHLEHARELLCWHAFLQPSPLEGFEVLVEMFVNVCKGLPLSLKVIGGLLYRNTKDYWSSQLNKISRLLPKDIKETLKISYDALDEEDKEMFLDIACFFIGERKSLAIAVWDGSEWSGVHGWETLVNKCLVEFDENNIIRMHDQLRDLGKEIAIRQSPYRLWLPEQIADIEKHAAEKRVLIRGIIAQSHEFHEDFTAPVSSHYQTPFEECMELVRSSSKEFRRCRPLELLVVRNNYFTEEFATLSRGLVWLRWFNLGDTTLPWWLWLKNLRVLELDVAHRLKELWEDNVDPPLELRELIITDANYSLLSFPRSIGRLKYLKTIVLSVSSSKDNVLRCLPEEFCLLKSLEHLTLRDCTSLRSLPNRFGDLTNLRHLDLYRCTQLKMLPVSFKQLIRLQYINLEFCCNLYFTSENIDVLVNMTKLEILNLEGCNQLQELPLLTNKGSLRELHLDYMHGLKELPSNIGQLSKLEMLEIGSPLLRNLPTSLGKLSSLTSLDISKCVMLKSLPDSIGGLILLENMRISDTGIESLPNAIVQLNNLQHLKVSRCPLRDLAFLSCSSSLCCLKLIDLGNTLVSKLSISQQCCPRLETLLVFRNDYLTHIETLPISMKAIELNNCKNLKSISGIGGLVNLQQLVILGCCMLDELPSFAELVSLKEFVIKETATECKKIKGLQNSRSLEILRAHTSWQVAAIESLEHMKNLTILELSACNLSAIQPCLQTIK